MAQYKILTMKDPEALPALLAEPENDGFVPTGDLAMARVPALCGSFHTTYAVMVAKAS